jgi:hypothetical protein
MNGRCGKVPPPRRKNAAINSKKHRKPVFTSQNRTVQVRFPHTHGAAQKISKELNFRADERPNKTYKLTGLTP